MSPAVQESIAINTVENKKRNLTLRFCLAAILVIAIVVVGVSGGAYLQLRCQAIKANFDAAQAGIRQHLVDMPEGAELEAASAQQFTHETQAFFRSINVISYAVFDTKSQFLHGSQASLSGAEQSALSELLKSNSVGESVIVDSFRPQLFSLNDLLGDKNQPISGIVRLHGGAEGQGAALYLKRTYANSIEDARESAKQVFWMVLAGSLMLFFALFFNFRRGVQTIEGQEKALNQQVTRLSALLDANHTLQQSMKTASSRAVEMNEQFLRRVGSDLHDGPAQTLGYAILRLNKIGEDDQNGFLGQDFHAVREALESSLKEVRGISSGLVLPELEQMTLEQALTKIIARHKKRHDTEVQAYYSDLPQQVSLPIKITAYRFVQEGLNNAHRHGQAERCRVSAGVKNGILHLSLKDNGMGFRKSQLSTDDGHLGLMGLKDRVESLGGKFSINSELGVGTAIKVSLALDDKNLFQP